MTVCTHMKRSPTAHHEFSPHPTPSTHSFASYKHAQQDALLLELLLGRGPSLGFGGRDGQVDGGALLGRPWALRGARTGLISARHRGCVSAHSAKIARTAENHLPTFVLRCVHATSSPNRSPTWPAVRYVTLRRSGPPYYDELPTNQMKRRREVLT